MSTTRDILAFRSYLSLFVIIIIEYNKLSTHFKNLIPPARKFPLKMPHKVILIATGRIIIRPTEISSWFPSTVVYHLRSCKLIFAKKYKQKRRAKINNTVHTQQKNVCRQVKLGFSNCYNYHGFSIRRRENDEFASVTVVIKMFLCRSILYLDIKLAYLIISILICIYVEP